MLNVALCGSGRSHVYRDHPAVLSTDSQCEPDVVLVEAPTRDRASLCMEAAQAKQDICVEIPFSASMAETVALMDVCQQHNVRLIPGQPLRFYPAVSTVKEAVDAGQLGIPGLVRSHRWQAGGDLWHLLVQELDIAIWLIGSEPTSIYATGPTTSDRVQWDYLQVHLGFANEAMGLIDIHSTLPPGNDYYSLSVIGSSGAAYADDHHNMQLQFQENGPVAMRTGQGSRHLWQQLDLSLGTLAGDIPPTLTIDEAMSVMQVGEAVAQSVQHRATLIRKENGYELH